MNRKLTWILFVSLALNVLLGAMWAGHMMRPDPYYHHAKPTVEEATLLSQLPEAKREEFTRVMDNLQDNWQAMHQEFKKMRKDTLALLTTDPFDREAYRERVTEMHHMRDAMKERSSRMIEELAQGWNLEERKILAKLLKRPPKWWRRCPDSKEQSDVSMGMPAAAVDEKDNTPVSSPSRD